MAAGLFFLLMVVAAGAAILYCLPRRIAEKILSSVALFGIGLLLAFLVRILLSQHLTTAAWMFVFLLVIVLAVLLVRLFRKVFGFTTVENPLDGGRPFLLLPHFSGGQLILGAVVLTFLTVLAIAASDSGHSSDDTSVRVVLFILITVLGLFVWGILRALQHPTARGIHAACPPISVLQDLLGERVKPAEHVRLAAHLELCSTCQHRVEGLTAGQHVWPGLARKLSQGPLSPEPALQKVMARLKDDQGETTRDEPALAGDLPLGFLSPSDKPGQLGRLERYEVLEEIGRGGMGVVLKAFDPSLHRVVAIKVLAPQLATSGVARKRFLREAKAAAAVTHDHIVTIHAVDEANGLPYLVMQYVAGQSLQQRIDKDGPLELPDILRIGMQTASGLAAAHAHGIVHRDIKPANILLEEGVQRVKLTDFGLARAMDDASLTQSGFVAGSPLYMAPEQARGEALDHRADLFSLGSVLYTMCTGRPPFRAANTLAVLRRVCEDPPRPIRETNPEIPDWLTDMVTKLMAKEPAERFSSAAEVEQELGQHLAQLQHGAWLPTPRAPVPAGSSDLPTSVTICPTCGASLHVPERMLGTLVHCAECGKPFQVEEGSEVIQVARSVGPLLAPRPKARSLPRWTWVALGGGILLGVVILVWLRSSAMRDEALAATTSSRPDDTRTTTMPPASGLANPGPQTSGENASIFSAADPAQQIPWRNTLTWLPSEASLFGAIVFKPFGSLTLDDPIVQLVVHQCTQRNTAEQFSAENLGRIRIDALSFGYYEASKTENAHGIVHLQGLALDGRKRIIDFVRRDSADKVQVEERHINYVNGKSSRLSGASIPFALGIYDDEHVFLAHAFGAEAKQAQHVKALEHLPWFVFPKIGSSSPDVLSGYNPPWIQLALSKIPADDCAVVLGEIPAGLRKLLVQTLKLRVPPRSFVFHLIREREHLTLELTLNVDKMGGETLLEEDLDQGRRQLLDTLTATFPAVRKDTKSLAVVAELLKQMHWEANRGNKSVQTYVPISPGTWKALSDVVKGMAKASSGAARED